MRPRSCDGTSADASDDVSAVPAVGSADDVGSGASTKSSSTGSGWDAGLGSGSVAETARRIRPSHSTSMNASGSSGAKSCCASQAALGAARDARSSATAADARVFVARRWRATRALTAPQSRSGGAPRPWASQTPATADNAVSRS